MCSYNTNTTKCGDDGYCRCSDDKLYIPTTDNATCGLKIAELETLQSCFDSAQCLPTNSECREEKCLCKHEFTMFNKTFCGKSIGDECDVCTDLEHTVCEGRCECNKSIITCNDKEDYYAQDLTSLWTYSDEMHNCTPDHLWKERCSCDNTTVPNTAQNTCLPIVTQMYSSCLQDNQCTPTWKHSLCLEEICVCSPTYVYAEDDCLIRALQIGGDCKSSKQCMIPNSECSEGKCECKKLYTEEFNTCVAYLYRECSSETDCPVAYSTCQNGRCACKEGYTALNDTVCGRGIGDRCDPGSDPCGNISASLCKSSTCQCDTGYISNIAGNRCLSYSNAINSSCEESQQCTEHWGSNSACLNKICQCKEGFVNDDTTCIKTVNELGMECSFNNQCLVDGAVCNEDTKRCHCGNMLTEFNTSYCGAAVNDDCRIHNCDAIDSICSSYGWCICNNGFTATVNETMCLKLSNIGELCSDIVQCTGSLGNGSTCLNEVCTCLDGYKFYKNKCTSYVSKLGEKCDKNTQVCYLENNGGFDQTQCRDGICQCINGLTPSDDKLSCNSSAVLKGATLWLICTLSVTFLNLKRK